MKIEGIDTYLVDVGHRDLCFVKVRTDEGLYGVGEIYSAGPDEATANVVHYFESWLAGPGSPGYRGHLAEAVHRVSLPGRVGGQLGAERHRPRALGPQGEGLKGARVPVVGRPVPPAYSRLPEPRRPQPRGDGRERPAAEGPLRL